MKKMTILLIASAAILAALSCNKENPREKNAGGIPFTFEVAAPEFEVADPASKVSFNGSNLKHKFDAGDQIGIISYTWATPKENAVVSNWGMFTTDNGGAYARFHGNVPADYTEATHGSTIRLFHRPGMSSMALDWNSTSGRFDFKYNIPANQDGTGLKYCMFANSNTVTLNMSDPEKPKFSAGPQFRCFNGLCLLNVTGGDVRTIRVTVNHAKNANYFVVSKGEAKDIVYNCANNGTSGGAGKVITINNNDEVLSGDIFFAIRQTNGNATQGYASMTFEFINGEGKTCTKRMVLAKNPHEDGTADSYVNVSSYFTLSKLGSIDLTSATFE